MEYDLDMLIDVKGWKALGNKLSTYPVKEITLIQSEKVNENEPEEGNSEGAEGTEAAEADQELEIGSTIDLTPKKDEDEQLGLF